MQPPSASLPPAAAQTDANSGGHTASARPPFKHLRSLPLATLLWHFLDARVSSLIRRVIEEARLSKLRAAPKALASAGKDLGGFPFLASLAEREEMVRNGKLTTIIFIRDVNQNGRRCQGTSITHIG